MMPTGRITASEPAIAPEGESHTRILTHRLRHKHTHTQTLTLVQKHTPAHTDMETHFVLPCGREKRLFLPEAGLTWP